MANRITGNISDLGFDNGQNQKGGFAGITMVTAVPDRLAMKTGLWQSAPLTA